jgi:hypothetical protein
MGRPGWALVLALAACGSGTSPETVARSFWEAVEGGDAAEAARRTHGARPDAVEEAFRGLALSDVELGETLTGETTALVVTSLSVEGPSGARRVPFHTHLVRDDEGWRVDLEQTRAELRKATFVAEARELGESLGESLREAGDALEQGVRALNEAIREALEEMEGGGRTL